MRLRPDQLAVHLRKNLVPLYLVFGEEPLQVLEAADAIRLAARERGYAERQCLTVETGFEWGALARLAASPSLFTDRRLLELRLDNAKTGDAGAKALADYAARPAEDAVLLVTAGKLDWNTQKSRWFTALDQVGVVIAAMPLDSRQLLGWIERRLRDRGLNPTADAVTLLAERVEGNLLAAAQDIEKLLLLTEDRQLTLPAVLAAVDDSARYSIYDFVDAGLLGQADRVTRVLNGLREEGVEPVLVNWALHQEVRRLATLAFARSQGQTLEAGLAEQKIWEKRKPLPRQAMQRLTLADCRQLLRDCARTDQVIKGIKPGSGWGELLTNGLRLAGLELLTEQIEQSSPTR